MLSRTFLPSVPRIMFCYKDPGKQIHSLALRILVTVTSLNPSSQLNNTGVQEVCQIKSPWRSRHHACLLEDTTEKWGRHQHRHILSALDTHARGSVMTRAGISAQSSGYVTACNHAYTKIESKAPSAEINKKFTLMSSSGYPNVCWINATLGPARCSGEVNVRT